MLRGTGNLIEEGIPLTRDLLDYCLHNNIFISLKNGDYSKEKFKTDRSKNNESLAKQLRELVLSGQCYLTKYISVFGVRSCPGLKKSLKITESLSHLYPDEINDYRVERNGVVYPFQSKEIRDKASEVIKEKFGVEHPFCNPNVQSKIRSDNKEKFGVEYPFQSKEIQGKVQDTNKEKFGVEYPFQSKEIQGKIKKSNLSERLLFIDEIRRNPDHLDQNKPDVIDWIKRNYPGTQQYKYLNEFNLVPPWRSYAEYKIQKFLRSLGVEFEINTRRILSSGMELDVWIPNHRVAIEVNGVYWHSTKRKDRLYHYRKKMEAQSLGINLLMFTDKDVEEQFDVVSSIIESQLGLSTRLEIMDMKDISNEDAHNFMIENWVKRDINSFDCAVAIVDGKEIKGVITFDRDVISNVVPKMSYRIDAGDIPFHKKILLNSDFATIKGELLEPKCEIIAGFEYFNSGYYELQSTA